MKLFTLDVGQGQLAVLVGVREAVVIDTKFPSSTDTDAPFIKGVLSDILGDRKVVGVVLTGLDADHADKRGVSWVVGKYLPHWIMYPCYFQETGNAAEVFATIGDIEKKRRGSQRDLERISVRLDRKDCTRERNDLSDEWKFTLFSPHLDGMNCSNNGSLVVKVESKAWLGGFSYLITGDTENDRWAVINEVFGSDLAADVLAAPHHGSDNAINEDTLALVSPYHVIVSAGRDNPYGHPGAAALALYEASGAEVFSTQQGSLCTEAGLIGMSTEVVKLHRKRARR